MFEVHWFCFQWNGHLPIKVGFSHITIYFVCEHIAKTRSQAANISKAKGWSCQDQTAVSRRRWLVNSNNYNFNSPEHILFSIQSLNCDSLLTWKDKIMMIVIGKHVVTLSAENARDIRIQFSFSLRWFRTEFQVSAHPSVHHWLSFSQYHYVIEVTHLFINGR